MSKRFWSRHIWFKRSIAILIAMAFILNYTLLDVHAAIEAITPPDTLDLEGPGIFDVERIVIPSHLGEVRFLGRGSATRTVIHLQDAHCNIYAQKKIADLIGYLQREYGITVLNLEGGSGDYDLSMFTSITGEAVRKEVAEYFVGKGEVNGAEYYAINNPGSVDLWGVEDKKLYMDNLKVYRDSLSYRPEVFKYINEIGNALDGLKRKVYSEELFKLDAAYCSYKYKEADLRAYMETLMSYAASTGVDIGGFSNLFLLGKAMSMEEGIDFRKANKERDELIARLNSGLSRREISELVTKTVEFKSSRLSRMEFYGYLLRKASTLGMNGSSFPDLADYTEYVTAYESVNRMMVMTELEGLESAIKEKLFRNEDEKILSGLSKQLALTRNIFEISLTKNDYAYYQNNRDTFKVENFIKFFEAAAAQYGVSEAISPDARNVDHYLSKIAGFYEYSFKRDDIFLKNMKFAPVEGGKEAAILITGGFHTENLCDLFESQNISYVSVIPRFTSSIDYKCPYFDLLAGETVGVEAMLRSVLARASTLQVASHLSGLGEAVWGKEGTVLFKAAVYIQARIREGKRVELLDEGGNTLIADGRSVIFGKDGDTERLTVNELLEKTGLIIRVERSAPRTGRLSLNMKKARMLLDGISQRLSSEEALRKMDLAGEVEGESSDEYYPHIPKYDSVWSRWRSEWGGKWGEYRIVVQNTGILSQLFLLRGNVPVIHVNLIDYLNGIPELETIWLNPVIRGEGIGTRINREIFKYLKEAGYTSIRIIPADREAAREYWAKFNIGRPSPEHPERKIVRDLEELIQKANEIILNRIVVQLPGVAQTVITESPYPEGPRPRMTEERKEHFLRGKTKREKEIAKKIINNITNVSFKTFKDRVSDVTKKVNAELQGRPFAVFFDDKLHSSKRWVYHLARDWIDHPPVWSGHFAANRSLRLAVLLESGVKDILVMDDAIYSGQQVDSMVKIIDMEVRRWMKARSETDALFVPFGVNIIVSVPYATEHGEETITRAVKDGPNSVNVLTSEKIPTVGQILADEFDKHDMGIFQGMRRNSTLTFFEHRVADLYSFADEARPLIADADAPKPYGIKDSSYYQEEYLERISMFAVDINYFLGKIGGDTKSSQDTIESLKEAVRGVEALSELIRAETGLAPEPANIQAISVRDRLRDRVNFHIDSALHENIIGETDAYMLNSRLASRSSEEFIDKEVKEIMFTEDYKKVRDKAREVIYDAERDFWEKHKETKRSMELYRKMTAEAEPKKEELEAAFALCQNLIKELSGMFNIAEKVDAGWLVFMADLMVATGATEDVAGAICDKFLEQRDMSEILYNPGYNVRRKAYDELEKRFSGMPAPNEVISKALREHIKKEGLSGPPSGPEARATDTLTVPALDRDRQISAAKETLLDQRGGKMLDIIRTPFVDIAESEKAHVGTAAGRKFRKDYGSETLVKGFLYEKGYGDEVIEQNVLGAFIEDAIIMIERDSAGEDARAIYWMPNHKVRSLASDTLGRLRVMDTEELDKYIKAMGIDAKRAERIMAGLKGLPLDKICDRINIVEGSEIPDGGLSDEIMHVLAGKRLLEVERYRRNVFGEGVVIDPAAKERIVDFLRSLDPSLPADDPDVLEKILDGLVAVRIVPIDFKEISEWKAAQDEVLRSL